MTSERTKVSDATRQAEAEEAQAPHVDRTVTSEENSKEAAIEDREVDEDVRAHYQEMAEMGAEERGEGRIP
jgi:hypothetical protein